MELLFLGTGSGVPSKQRNVSSSVLKMLNEYNTMWMFDCGEGTQQQILRTTLKPRKVSKIFITHLHGDHIFGLPGFLSSRAFQGGEEPIDIYGPQGIKRYVLTSLKTSGTYLKYRLRFHEFNDEEGVLFQENRMRVSYKKLKHGLPSYGFRIVEADKQGELLVDKLQEEGVPSGPLYGKLKAGETVELEDGRVLDGKDYLGPTQKGKIIAILGDTKKTQASIELAQDADILVHESTFSHQNKDLAKDYNHSTNIEAAEVARDASVGKLLLTHISSRYVGKAARELEKEARTIFPNTDLMHDFSEVTL